MHGFDAHGVEATGTSGILHVGPLNEFRHKHLNELVIGLDWHVPLEIIYFL